MTNKVLFSDQHSRVQTIYPNFNTPQVSFLHGRQSGLACDGWTAKARGSKFRLTATERQKHFLYTPHTHSHTQILIELLNCRSRNEQVGKKALRNNECSRGLLTSKKTGIVLVQEFIYQVFCLSTAISCEMSFSLWGDLTRKQWSWRCSACVLLKTFIRVLNTELLLSECFEKDCKMYVRPLQGFPGKYWLRLLLLERYFPLKANTQYTRKQWWVHYASHCSGSVSLKELP